YEAYAENRFWVTSAVALMAGAKAFSSDRDYTDYWRPQNSASKTYNGVNPKVGVLWQPKPDVQVFADVTRSQDVPDFSDLVQTQVNGATGFV
ncbi:TonB-dependent receptor, partial [Acinetobacter baumannii]